MNNKSNERGIHNTTLNIADDVMIRVVVAQTTNHQAARVGSREFPAEPTVSESLLALHEMKKADISTAAIAKQCSRDYEQWSRARLEAVLSEFGSLCKDSEESTAIKDNNVVAAILVFPEYSILREHCVIIREWLDKLINDNEISISIAIFAGTHTLPDEKDAEKLAIYERIGIGIRKRGKRQQTLFGFDDGSRRSSDIKDFYSEGLPTLSILPIFKYEPDSEGQRVVSATTILKRILSPFELTNDQPHKMPEGLDIDSRIVDIKCKVGNNKTDGGPGGIQNIRILPLICSEALQLTLGRGERNFDIAVIPAYNNGTAQFNNIVGQFRDNGILTVLCNDGKTGESGFFLPQTLGRGESGWFDAPSNGKLPPGDCVVSADVSLRNLADTVKINYSVERCRLQKLSAIVPRNLTEPSYLVARCLQKVSERETKIGKFDSRFDILQDCLDNRGLSLLQRRKIKRLLKLKNVSRSIWRFYGNDIYFGDEEKKDTLTFSALEAKLRSKVLVYCSKIAATEQLKPDEYQKLKEVIDLLSKTWKSQASTSIARSDSLLISYFGEFISDVKSVSEKSALSDITKVTEALVEDLYGASAYVLCNSPDVYFANPRPADTSFDMQSWRIRDNLPLKTVFVHHAPNKRRAYPKEGTMAGRCVDIEECIVSPDFYNFGTEATRPPFEFVNPNTRSAIAMPIAFENGDQLDTLGAIVLESPEANCFTDLDIGELKYRALELLAPLAFFRQKFRFPLLSIQWYPPSTGGNTQELYQLAISHLEKRLQKRAGTGGAAVTLWERDPGGNSNERSSAIATIGYSREYTNRRQLPLSGKILYEAKSNHMSGASFDSAHWGAYTHESDPVEVWQPSVNYTKGDIVSIDNEIPKSHVGQFFFEPHGASSSTHWRQSRLYNRIKKAERSQLGHLCCISIDANKFFHENLRHVFKFEEKQLASTHVLSIFTFSHSQVRVHDLLHEEQLERLADLTGAFIGTTTLQLVQWARHKFRHQVGAVFSSSVAANQLREAVSSIVTNNGCSILAVEQPHAPRKLKFVSSSGLSRLGTQLGSVEEADLTYDIAKDTQHDTVRILSLESNEFICKNKRFKAVGPERPLVRRLESYTLSDNEHRKTLLVRASGYENGKRVTCAVIRLVRARDSKFFSIADVSVAATLASDVFRYWKQTGLFFANETNLALTQVSIKSDKSITDEELDRRKASGYVPPNQKVAAKYLETRSNALFRATRRVATASKGLSTFTSKSVDMTVRDVFFVFDRYQSVLSTLRVMKRARTGQKGLAIHSFHAHSDFQLREEEAGAFIYQDEGGIGWRSLNQNLGYLTNGNVEQFTRILPEVQHETENAFCVPFLIPLRGKRTFPAVFSIEWAKKIEQQELTHFELAIVYNSCARIASSAYGPIEPDQSTQDGSERILQLIKEFMESQNKPYHFELFVGHEYSTTIQSKGCKHFKDILDLALDDNEVYDLESLGPEKLLPILTSRRGDSTGANRAAPAQDRDYVRQYHGRHSVQTFDDIRYLADRRCKIIPEQGLLVYPLEFGGIHFGRLIAKLDDCRNLSDFECVLNINKYAELGRSLDELWFDLAHRIYYSPDFGIEVEQKKQSDHFSYRAFFQPEKRRNSKHGVTIRKC